MDISTVQRIHTVSCYIVGFCMSLTFAGVLLHPRSDFSILPASLDPCIETEEFSSSLRNIFCRGDILQTVNELHIFYDQKEFVDLPLKTEPDKVLEAFAAIDRTNKSEVVAFLHNYFFAVNGTELVPFTPPDWNETSVKFDVIRDRKYRAYADDLQEIWKDLCRKENSSSELVNRSTLIPLPHHFIVPGGRFREVYYWDSFWIIKGLIASNMLETAKAMVRNMAYLVKRFGFVPNGSRYYYLRRSQPPTLALSVDAVYAATKDREFLREILPVLEAERRFWDQQRRVNVVVNGVTYFPYRYTGGSNTPRPESYRADVELAESFLPADRPQLWQHIAAAAESGWDFSSRWFRDLHSLNEIATVDVIPVDLNAFMCAQADILARLYAEIGNNTQAQKYQRIKAGMDNLIEALFWSDVQESYFDFWLNKAGKQTLADDFYISTIVPLFVGCGRAREKEKAIFKYLNDTILTRFPFGVPTSIHQTGQQWDFPNFWAPHVHMLIEALGKSELPQLKNVSLALAQKFVKLTYDIFEKSANMYEKYRVDQDQVPGHGGEYVVQKGFGWTNGVVLDLLITYGAQLGSGTGGAIFTGTSTSSGNGEFDPHESSDHVCKGVGSVDDIRICLLKIGFEHPTLEQLRTLIM